MYDRSAVIVLFFFIVINYSISHGQLNKPTLCLQCGQIEVFYRNNINMHWMLPSPPHPLPAPPGRKHRSAKYHHQPGLEGPGLWQDAYLLRLLRLAPGRIQPLAGCYPSGRYASLSPPIIHALNLRAGLPGGPEGWSDALPQALYGMIGKRIALSGVTLGLDRISGIH